LKAPPHLFAIAALLAAIPDACVVQTHRDPCKVLASTCSLFCAFRTIFSDRVAPAEVAIDVCRTMAAGLRRAMEVRRAVDPGRIFDVSYHELTRNPIDTIRRLYDHFGYPWTEEFHQRAKDWMARNPQHKHGVHRYSLGQFGLSREKVEPMFPDYVREYGVEQEGERL
jgi:hypothetical protein